MERIKCESSNHINREVVCPSMALNEMDKALKRYELERVFAEQDAMQRQLRLILNKITPQNLYIHFVQVQEANIMEIVGLSVFVSQIVGRAVTEQINCETYVEFCHLLYDMLPYFSSHEKRNTLKHLLETECQKMIERKFMHCEDSSTIGKIEAHDYRLGSVRLIGELFKKNMIHLNIMQHCIIVLLERPENPDDENVEALCLLMSLAGKKLDNVNSISVDICFWKMKSLLRSRRISYRGRLMLRNCIDLRSNGWRESEEIGKPKKSRELQREHQLSLVFNLHKAERRYEVGRVFGTEDAKQRKLTSILNKLTAQNLGNLISKVRNVNINQIATLSFFASQIFRRALSEPTYCQLYANFCSCIVNELPVLCSDTEIVTFRDLLLNKCKQKFHSRDRTQPHAKETEKERFEVDSEESEIRERCQWLGNIQFIGELCRVQVLTERILVHCIKYLLEHQSFDDQDVEALCKLISIVGEMIDLPSFKEHVDEYFDIMEQISSIQNLPYRIRFKLMDVIDGRKDEWQRMKKTEKPKDTEDEMHISHRNEETSVIYLGSSSEENDEDFVFRVERKEIMFDEDCYILELDPCQSLTTTDLKRKFELTDDQEEDFCIVAEKGKVACRDYPHSRHLCVQYPFNMTNHENSCAQCYCYVCEERAPCQLWEGNCGHCHASDQEYRWNLLRAVLRNARKRNGR